MEIARNKTHFHDQRNENIHVSHPRVSLPMDVDFEHAGRPDSHSPASSANNKGVS
jgi:hypothetical protein